MTYSINTIFDYCITLSEEEYLDLANGSSISDNTLDALLLGILPQFTFDCNFLPVSSNFFPLLLRDGKLNFFSDLSSTDPPILNGTDMFSYDCILVPIHVSNHWIAATFLMHDKQILYFDSLMDSLVCSTSICRY